MPKYVNIHVQYIYYYGIKAAHTCTYKSLLKSPTTE